MPPIISPYRRLKRRYFQMLPHLRNFALDHGLLPGQTNYTRFVILGRSRSGSNFLRGLLNEHSQVIVFGELFQNFHAFDWAMPGFKATPRLIKQIQTDPVRFLDTRVFKRYSPEIAAVGFKIFYYHARDDSRQPVWPYLQGDKQIHIIHIKRKNILKTHLSRQRALATESWVNTTGDKNNLNSITLDYDACLADFIQTRQWETEFDRLFQHHPIIEVIYEDLARNYIEEMKRILGFLGVRSERVRPQTHKQASQPLSQAIANFADLRDRFAGTPWEDFFEG